MDSSASDEINKNIFNNEYLSPNSTDQYTNEHEKQYDKVPYSFSIIKQMQNTKTPNRPFLCLFDSDSTLTWISKKAIPNTIQPTISNTPLVGSTMAGNFNSNQSLLLQHITLPEFSPTRAITMLRAHVMTNPCRYDIIFGRDFCCNYGLVLDFESNIISSSHSTVPMREILPQNTEQTPLSTMLQYQNEDAYTMQHYDDNKSGYKSRTFTSAPSNKISLSTLIEQQQQLTKTQQKDLLQLLSTYPSLFDGGLGTCNKYEVEIELKPNAQPKASKAYPVARAHLAAFKERLD